MGEAMGLDWASLLAPFQAVWAFPPFALAPLAMAKARAEVPAAPLVWLVPSVVADPLPAACVVRLTPGTLSGCLLRPPLFRERAPCGTPLACV